jgi:hypothetical protein
MSIYLKLLIERNWNRQQQIAGLALAETLGEDADKDEPSAFNLIDFPSSILFIARALADCATCGRTMKGAKSSGKSFPADG